MRTEKDVEAYLLRSNRRFRVVEGPGDAAGTFIVESGSKLPPVAVRVDPPLVVIRAHVGDAPDAANSSAEQATLFRRLLEANARLLVHASYGIDEGRIVLSSALELENLDFNEIQATLDEIDLALAQPLPELAKPA
jgi:hypothetical protein